MITEWERLSRMMAPGRRVDAGGLERYLTFDRQALTLGDESPDEVSARADLDRMFQDARAVNDANGWTITDARLPEGLCALFAEVDEVSLSLEEGEWRDAAGELVDIIGNAADLLEWAEPGLAASQVQLVTGASSLSAIRSGHWPDDTVAVRALLRAAANVYETARRIPPGVDVRTSEALIYRLTDLLVLAAGLANALGDLACACMTDAATQEEFTALLGQKAWPNLDALFQAKIDEDRSRGVRHGGKRF